MAAGRHTLYLSTEGVTLTKATRPDSRINTTDLIADPTATVPQFLPNTAGREAFIAEIIRLVQVRLAPYSIDVVTTRPASGNYYMAVIGGDPTLVGQPATSGLAALSPQDCLAANPNLVDLIFDMHFAGGAGGAKSYATSILSDLGTMIGLGLTSQSGDCECRVNGCMFPDVCTFGATTPTIAPTCGHEPTQDEQALVKNVLGCR